MKPVRAILLMMTCVASAAAAQAKPKLAVMPLNAHGLEERVATILDSLVVIELDQVGRYEVIGATDIKAMLGFEGVKASLGCTDVSCVAELGGALGVDYLVSGVLGRLGSKILITAKLIDVKNMNVVRRASVKMPDNEDVFDVGIHDIVIQLLGPDPAVANRRLPKAGTEPAAFLATPRPTATPATATAATETPTVTAHASPSDTGLHNGFWIATATAGVAALGLGLVAIAPVDELQRIAEDNDPGSDPQPQLAAQEARDRAGLANILLIGGAALLAGTIPLFLFSRSLFDDDTTVAVAPQLQDGGVGVVSVVRF
jgi:TolB-like protein